MTFLEDFSEIAKKGVFWGLSITLVILAIAGIIFGIWLVYKNKDKIANTLISIPFGILVALIIVLLTKLVVGDAVADLWVDYAIIPGVSIFSFSTVFWLCKRFAIVIVRGLFKFKVITD